MATGNPIEILVRQNAWANEQMFDACAALSDEQFHREFEMGVGSLHHTLTHIIGAMQGWGDLLAQREQRSRLEYDRRSLDELRALHQEVSDDFIKSALEHSPAEQVSGERGGRSYTFTRAGVITHVATHGIHHRAQALNMLRQIGVEKLPPSSVVEWILMVDDQ